MEKTIDYKINEELTFRFYPEKSSCHGFDEEPPKTWEEVYKVYYWYDILETSRYAICPKVVFDSKCDECSILDEISGMCEDLFNDIETFEDEYGEKFPLLDEKFNAIGGSSWSIHKYITHSFNYYDEEDFEKETTETYEFNVFNYQNIGYRFILGKEQLKTFGEKLVGNLIQY